MGTLVWAHSEYLKLLRSFRDRRVFDRPPQTERYARGRRKDARALWRVEHPARAIPAGTAVRVEAIEGVEVRWRVGHGPEQTLPDEPKFLGVRVADIPTITTGTEVRFAVTRPGNDGNPRHEEHTLIVR